MHFGELLHHWSLRLFAPGSHLRAKYNALKELLEADKRALEIIADLETHLYGRDLADNARIRWLLEELEHDVRTMVHALVRMNPSANRDLPSSLQDVCRALSRSCPPPTYDTSHPLVLALDQVAAMPQLAGGKAAHLAAAGMAGVPIPAGVVITASAFHLFLKANGLDQVIESRFREISLANQEAIIRVTGEMQERILAGLIPEELEHEFLRLVSAIMPGEGLFAVRSSALAEDGHISFAGQYASELNVLPEGLLSAYKRVLAGKYCPRAVSYRITHGLSDADTAMAVLIVPMINHGVAGVAYTRDPACPAVGGEAIGVYAVAGLACELVEGIQTPDRYYLSRQVQPNLLVGCRSGGRIAAASLEQLGKYCMTLEEHFGSPRDIEWALDIRQQPVILQCRPLCQEKEPEPTLPGSEETSAQLLAGLVCASSGAACGPVFRAEHGHDFPLIPQGSVLVTSTLRPSLSLFLDRTAAVLATTGSRASHLASVARERGIPVLVGSGLERLPTGELVTVDAGAGTVSVGCLPSVLARVAKARDRVAVMRQSFETLAGLSVHLHLTDPSASGFCPTNCRSLHDFIRYCHEKGVSEMFSLVQRGGRGMGRSRRLQTGLPLVMYVLDLGGGLRRHIPKHGDLDPAHVTCLPMSACWKGMSDARIAWDDALLHVDWQEFDRMSGGIFAKDSRLLASYAVISRDYLHMNIRFGYHFSILDSICGDIPGANYIQFRFKGGGTALEGRMLRLLFINRVLSSWGFTTTIRSDMLDATSWRQDLLSTRANLEKIGLLLAKTRMLDTRLVSEDDALIQAGEFLNLVDSRPEDEH